MLLVPCISIKLMSTSWSNTACTDTLNLYENLYTFKLYIDSSMLKGCEIKRCVFDKIIHLLTAVFFWPVVLSCLQMVVADTETCRTLA